MLLVLLCIHCFEKALFAEENSGKAPVATNTSVPVAPTPASAEYPTLDALMVRHQPYLENISAYRPMYFLVGTDPEDSKFQFSFKYRLFNAHSDLAQELPALKGFHFAFTQTSFWDLESDSKPFQDTSYKPELFFLSPNIDIPFSGIKGLFIQTGLEHESNGQADEASRSTNFLYLHPILVYYDETNRKGFAIGPKIWAYAGNDQETNPDLPDYRGYFDIYCKIGKEDGWVLAADFGWARKGGSVQLDLTYPLNRLFHNTLDIYLNLQYVNRLAENLLHYEDRTEAFRVGLAVVR